MDSLPVYLEGACDKSLRSLTRTRTLTLTPIFSSLSLASYQTIPSSPTGRLPNLGQGSRLKKAQDTRGGGWQGSRGGMTAALWLDMIGHPRRGVMKLEG